MSILEQIELEAQMAWDRTYPIESGQIENIRQYCELLEMPVPALANLTIWQAERLLDALDNTLAYGVPFEWTRKVI